MISIFFRTFQFFCREEFFYETIKLNKPLEQWFGKKPQIPGVQQLFVVRAIHESPLPVRRNDEVAAQRNRWTFYETIKFILTKTEDEG